MQIRTFPISPGGRLPDLNRIIANPIPPDAGIAYTLFARYCELVIGLLQAGDAGGSDRLNRIFALQATGKAPAAALEMVAGDLQKPGETVQDWLEREYAQQARQKHLYADTDALAARLRELESLPMVGTGEKGTFGVARITLDQLVANGHGYKFSAGDYAALYRSYFTLSRDAPPLLQPAIQEYILALEALRAGKTRPFRQHFQKGRETFATGVAKQKALTEYLDELERNTSRPASTLRTILGPLIDQSRERRDALDPPLREYLRKVD